MTRATRFRALAVDYDDTLATNGGVTPSVLQGLQQLKDSGRRLLLITGRQLDELKAVGPDLRIFDRVVAENGALLYRPETGEELPLGTPPGQAFVDLLRRKQVTPLSVGRVIVATRTPQEVRVLKAIKELGLELEIIFNKGAVMVLPSGVNKASGLHAGTPRAESAGRPGGRRRRCRERSRVSRRLRVRRRRRERRSIAQGARQAGDDRRSR